MRYASIRKLDISNGEGIAHLSSFKDVIFIARIVLTRIRGILMVEKSGQKMLRKNLCN